MPAYPMVPFAPSGSWVAGFGSAAVGGGLVAGDGRVGRADPEGAGGGAWELDAAVKDDRLAAGTADSGAALPPTDDEQPTTSAAAVRAAASRGRDRRMGERYKPGPPPRGTSRTMETSCRQPSALTPWHDRARRIPRRIFATAPRSQVSELPDGWVWDTEDWTEQDEVQDQDDPDEQDPAYGAGAWPDRCAGARRLRPTRPPDPLRRRLPGEQRNRQLSEETFADVVRLLNPKLPMVRGRRADARRRTYTRTRPRCPPASCPRKRTGQKTGTAPRANFTTAITFAPP